MACAFGDREAGLATPLLLHSPAGLLHPTPAVRWPTAAGIKGVQHHCWFLKTIDDAHKLRVHLRWAGRGGMWCRSGQRALQAQG